MIRAYCRALWASLPPRWRYVMAYLFLALMLALALAACQAASAVTAPPACWEWCPSPLDSIRSR
jgi:hypothetical protein